MYCLAVCTVLEGSRTTAALRTLFIMHVLSKKHWEEEEEEEKEEGQSVRVHCRYIARAKCARRHSHISLLARHSLLALPTRYTLLWDHVRNTKKKQPLRPHALFKQCTEPGRQGLGREAGLAIGSWHTQGFKLNVIFQNMPIYV